MRKLNSTNTENKVRITNNCPLTSSLYLISGRWKLILIWNLQSGIHRFSELERAIPLITKKMLTQQLKELERDGMVNRKVYAVVPPKVEYTLTELATSLLPILQELYRWGDDNNIAEHIRLVDNFD